MISVIYSSNSNALGKATNWFSFVGLSLDLIGTCAGVVRALLLQKAIRRSHQLAVRLSGQIDGARHEVRTQQERHRRSSSTAPVDPHSRAYLTDSMRVISHAMAIFAEDGRFGVQAAAGTAGAQAPADHDPLGLGSLPSRGKGGMHPFHEWVRGILLNVEGVGHVPIVSLAGGGLCLLLSVVLFAGATQPHAVWLSCTSIAGGMLLWSVIPATNPYSMSACLCLRKRLLITSKSRAQPCRSLRSRRRNIGALSTRQPPSVSGLARKQLRHLSAVLLFTELGVHCSNANALVNAARLRDVLNYYCTTKWLWSR